MTAHELARQLADAGAAVVIVPGTDENGEPVPWIGGYLPGSMAAVALAFSPDPDFRVMFLLSLMEQARADAEMSGLTV